MKWLKTLDSQSIIPIYRQIKDSVLKAIEDGELKKNSQIPSINKISGEFGFAPGTVIRAYEELKEMGIISSKQGKGFFIASTDIKQKTRVFLLFDRINAFKEIIYEAFLEHLGKEAEVYVFFHHYDKKRFEKLIRDNLGHYSHYVIMPHLSGDISKILRKVPEKKLILIDAKVEGFSTGCNAVFQDFEHDVFSGLQSKLEQVRKYQKLSLSLSKSKFQFVPDGCIAGFRKFCETYQLEHEVLPDVTKTEIRQGELYIVYDDNELFHLLERIKIKGWEVGKDIGIISYDDTPMKRILAGGISVLSTDFYKLGQTAAEMVNGNIKGQIANPFQLIGRNSF
jgi:DNA-binding transcriptional regulator YhcF (GntR family)